MTAAKGKKARRPTRKSRRGTRAVFASIAAALTLPPKTSP